MIKKKNNFYLEKLFFLILCVPLIVLIFFSSISFIFSDKIFYNIEYLSNFFSTFIAALVWALFYINSKNFINIKVLNIISLLFFFKVSLNFLFFFSYQLPLYNVETSYGLNNINSGDVGLIHLSTLNIISAYPNLLERFFTEINFFNNKGTLYLYSIIYEAFGHYPTNTIPWDALVLAFSSMLFYEISNHIFKKQNSILLPVIIFLLPSFLITPLLYRDVYLLFFLSLTIYIIFNEEKFIIKKIIFLICLSFIFFYFRKIYAILPILFYSIFLFINHHVYRTIMMCFIIIFIIFISVFINFYSDLIFLNSFETGLKKNEISSNFLISFFNDIQLKIIHGYRSGGEIVTFVENQNFFIKIIFRFIAFLISPFPWYFNQYDYNSFYNFLLISQVFVSFMIYFHTIDIFLMRKFNKNFFIILAYFFIICIIATFGALQFTHYYIIIAVPMLMTTLLNVDKKYFLKYFSLSLVSAIVLHITYYFIKSSLVQ